MRHFKMATIGLVFATGAVLAACSGDDTAVSAPDSGTDGSGGSSSGGSSSGSSSGSSGSSSGTLPGDGGGDGGAQDFSVFVKGLIANDTTATATPAAIPAPGTYTDNQSQADYPATFFQ